MSFGLVLLALSTIAFAMRVSPMIIEMTSTGTESSARLEVQNLNQTRLAYDVRVYRITYDEQGGVTETPADEDFLIFPPQGAIPPGGRQVMRLQWVGEPNLRASQSYYVAVNQLPVQLDPGATPEDVSGQLQIVYTMKALVVVAPPGATPMVEAAAARPIDYRPPAPEGVPPPPTVPGVEITLRNTGNRHAMMAGLRWVIDGTSESGEPLQQIFTPEELNRLIGVGYLAPLDGTRTFRLPVETAFGSGPIRVRFAR
ncbi:MAG: molecular chaperone [Sphingomonas sp.]|nr:molecular chaperone [Sphingomonas sp.]